MNGCSHQKHEKSQKKNVLARILAPLMGGGTAQERRAMVGLRKR